MSTMSSSSNGNGNSNSSSSNTVEALFEDCGYDAESLALALEAERDVMGSRNSNSDGNSSRAALHITNAVAHEPETGLSLRIPRQAALQELSQAVLLLPPETRQAYERARALNPHIVDIESPPLHFLKTADYNYWKAADQLANYWTQRRRFMGDERYHLPVRLHQDNTSSCLSANADECLRSGGLFWASQRDQFHRPVLVLDDVKFHRFNFYPDKDEISSQALFYLLQTLWIEQGGGDFVIPCLISLDHGPHTMRPASGFLPVAQSECFPTVKPRSFHMVIHKSTSTNSSLTSHLFIEALKALGKGWNFFAARTRVHNIQHQHQALQVLQPYGFTKHHIPTSWGSGTENTNEWLQERYRIERARYQQPTSAVDLHHDQNNEHGNDRDSDNHKNQRRRSNDHERNVQKMDDFRVWAQRHLHHCEVQKLQAEQDAVKERQQELRDESNFLESQLACASFLAEQHDEDQQKVLRLLARFVAPITTTNGQVPEEDGTDREKSNTALAQSLLDQYITFLGRKPHTGQWMFLMKPNLTPKQQDISLRIQLYLLEEQLNSSTTLMKACAPDSKCVGKQTSKKQDDVGDLDMQLASLQAQVATLRNQRASQLKVKSFLESATCFSSQLAKMIQDFMKEHRPLLIQVYASILAASTSKSSSSPSSSLHAKVDDTKTSSAAFCKKDISIFNEQGSILADQVLANHTCFDGIRGVVNAGVTVALSLAANDQSSSRTDANTHNVLVAKYLLLMTLCRVVPRPTATGAEKMLSPAEERKRRGDGNDSQQQQQQQQQLDSSMPQDEQQQARQQQQYRIQRKKMLKRL